MGRQSGFSLLECVLVVAIALLLAAISLPRLWAARLAAREGRAMSNLRTLANAHTTFYTLSGRFGFPSELFASRCLADGSFARVGGSSGGPTPVEVLSDGTYEFSGRYAVTAAGLTLDADPGSDHAATHRRFRLRIGRTAAGSSGGEGVLLAAAPSRSSPPSSAYRPLP